MRTAGVAAYLAGLAAAAGAGAVLGLASAAPASADDSGPEPGQRSAERSSVSGPTGNRGGHARAVPPTRVARAAAAVPVSTVASARKDSAPLAAPALPRALSSVPAGPTRRQPGPVALPPAAAPVVAVTPPAPAATVPVGPGAGIPAAAGTRSPHNFYLDPRGQRVTVLKGVHFVIPGSFGLFTRQVYGTGTFTADSAYDLKDVDQYDWNKFSGIAYSPFQRDKNSAMVGWRYNLTSGQYEIAPFYNVNKERVLPNEQTEVISVPADATFQYRVDYTGITLSYGGKTVFKPYPAGLTPNVWTASRVSGWFGGNEVAPRTLSYYLSFNWW